MKSKKKIANPFSGDGLCPKKAIPAELLKTLERDVDLPGQEQFRTITDIDLIEILSVYKEQISALAQSFRYIADTSQADRWEEGTRTRADEFEPNYTSAEVCKFLRITDRTLRNYMNKGWITPHVSPTHQLLFTRSSIKKYLDLKTKRRKR
jgi:hypothetical protein